MLLLLLCSLTMGAVVYELGDVMYAVPNCVPGPVTDRLFRPNSFGQLLLDNSLLGSQLRFTVVPDPGQVSCRFCQRLNLCSQTFGNTSDLHLTYDTRYNIRIVSVDQLPDSVVGLSVAVPQPPSPEAEAIVWVSGEQLGLAQLCGQRRRLVVMLYMTAEAPAVRDFQVQAWDPATLATVPCSTAPTMADLTCRTTAQYYVLDYTATNCLDDGAPLVLTPPSATEVSYVGYYYEAVAMSAPEALPSLRLCGETWLSLYQRCRLEVYCDADQALFIALKPWYQAALYATAAWQNGRRDSALWQALEELEQYCEARDLVLDLLVNLSQTLAPSPHQREAEAADWALLCEWARVETNQSHVTDNVTLPFYFYHHRDWYFDTFRHIVYYNDPQMAVKSALLVTLAVVSLTVVLLATAWTVRRVWQTVRLRRSNEEYLLV